MDTAASRLSLPLEDPRTLMRTIGVVRIILLAFLSVGAVFLSRAPGVNYLVLLYAAAFFFGIAYLYTLSTSGTLRMAQAWAQVLLDFSVVCVTIVYTEGPTSFFTFLFIVVILEAVHLLDLRAGLVAATLGSAFMLVQAVLPPFLAEEVNTFELWYNFLVQALAFYLTAFIAGHWSHRISQMRRYQREILDNLNSGFLITDATGTITVQNRAASVILGLNDNEAVNRHVADVLRVESGSECPVVTALRAERDFTSYEFSALAQDGRTMLLGISTNRILDEYGKTSGIIVSFTDLTEMNEMREELRQHDRMAVIGELAAGLAHEIRNPVAVIRGAVDEMMSRDNDPKLEARLQSIAIRESDHLNEIVSGFLDFARNPKPKREQFDLRNIVEEVGDLMAMDLGESGESRIRIDYLDEPCDISGDPSQIKQVFVNLAKNGIEAMDDKGVLHIQMTKKEHVLEVRFEDDGPGIPPDKIGRIFEPFYTTKKHGVGMGLAICQRIITAHDGTIQAFSRENGGCRMSVRLPAIVREESLA